MNSVGSDDMCGEAITSRRALRQIRPEAPLFSIITVVLNGAAHIEQTITSVLSQSYQNYEYIVIDGGSKDGTLDIIRKYSEHIDEWVSEPDSGIYAAMNKGLRMARGELVGLLNADDFYEPDALQKVACGCMEGMRTAIYYGDNMVLQDDLQLKYKRHASLEYWLGMTICHQAMFVHRDIYRELGGYREEFRFAADYDFLLRAVSARVEMVYVPAFLVNYRDTGLTSRHYAASLAEAKLINRRKYGLCSFQHTAYLARYCRTLVLYAVQKVVLQLCGRQRLNRLRRFYLRTVLLKNVDILD